VIDWYISRNREVVREALYKVRADEYRTNNLIIDEMIDFFNRKNDIARLRQELKLKFATRIEEDAVEGQKDSAVGDSGSVRHLTTGFPRLDIRELEAAAIDYRHVEVINTGLGSRIVSAIGTLGTEVDQAWQYVDTTSDTDVDDVQDLIDTVRKYGDFSRALVELDRMSVMVESSWLHIYYKGDQIEYDVVRPSNMFVKFGHKLVYKDENGDESPSFVDNTKIEDASAVIIRSRVCDDGFDYSGGGTNQYQAYVGACVDFEDGRYVVYRSKDPWPIPRPGDLSIEYEHKIKDKVCNPFTWLLHYGDDNERACVSTEYPVILWSGGQQFVRDGWPAISTGLYENSLELEIAWSRILRYALSGARGQDVFNIANGRMPHSLECFDLEPGDSYQHTGWASSNSRDAAGVLQIITEQVSGSFSVPGYWVIGSLSGMNPASGISLAIQTAPLISFRNHRYNLNKGQMARVFDIERMLLLLNYKKDAGGLLSPNIKQKWNAGTWKMPTTDLEDAQATTARLDNGTWDLVEGVRHTHRLSTDSEAEQKIEEMRERDPGYAGGAVPAPTGSKFGAGNG